eukprot:12470362-Alexandrium_andersonii.AAC.1
MRFRCGWGALPAIPVRLNQTSASQRCTWLRPPTRSVVELLLVAHMGSSDRLRSQVCISAFNQLGFRNSRSIGGQAMVFGSPSTQPTFNA